MNVERKRIGDVNSRGNVNIPLKPDYLLGSDVEPGDDIYIVYGKEMIVMCKKLNVVNKLAEKDFAVIIDGSKRRKGR